VSLVRDQNHAVQLFDTPESRGDAVFAFVRDGLLAGDTVLVVVTTSQLAPLIRRCRENGIDLNAARAASWITLLDANETLASILRRERPEWNAFERSIGTLVRQLAARGGRLRIYGEMVDILARPGEFDAAAELEAFWNRLQERHAFTLFCGYSAEHFGNPKDRVALRHICELHSHVQSDPRDVLGNFLLKNPSPC
jgi:hypothetical protein